MWVYNLIERPHKHSIIEVGGSLQLETGSDHIQHCKANVFLSIKFIIFYEFKIQNILIKIVIWLKYILQSKYKYNFSNIKNHVINETNVH